MEAKEKILRPVGKGSAGIHLPHFKNVMPGNFTSFDSF